MAALRPPLPFRLLLGAGLLFTLPTLGYAVHYGMGWKAARMGKPLVQQRRSLHGVTWFKRPFTEFVERLARTIPGGSKVLVEPSRVEVVLGRARWYLFLNHYGYPLQFYVRQPAKASGTLVDYPGWLEHHTAGQARAGAGSTRLSEQLEIAERKIDWKVRFPMTERFMLDEVEVFQQRGGAWVRVPLAEPGAERGAERGADAE